MRMLATNREPAPPGEMLREESRKPLGLTMRLARALGTTPEFWLSGQIAVDLYRAEHDAGQIRAAAKIIPVIGTA